MPRFEVKREARRGVGVAEDARTEVVDAESLVALGRCYYRNIRWELRRGGVFVGLVGRCPVFERTVVQVRELPR